MNFLLYKNAPQDKESPPRRCYGGKVQRRGKVVILANPHLEREFASERSVHKIKTFDPLFVYKETFKTITNNKKQ